MVWAGLAGNSQDPISINSWAWWNVPVFPSYKRCWDPEEHGSRPTQAKKFLRSHLKWKEAGQDGACLSSQLWQEALNRRLMVQASLGKKKEKKRERERPYLKNNQSKKSWKCGSWWENPCLANAKPWVQHLPGKDPTNTESYFHNYIFVSTCLLLSLLFWGWHLGQFKQQKNLIAGMAWGEHVDFKR
jgi:hypothetical protein